MKKIALFALVLFLRALTTQAQTTLTEYNYVTKGYKNHLEDGSDLKKGYHLQDITNVGATSADKKARKAWLKAFVREESGQRKVAAYMVIYQLEGSPKEYLCIPHPASDREVTDRYFNDLHDGVGDASYKLQLLSFLLARNLKW